MANVSRSVLRHAVQTSPDFSTWTTQDTIRCDECSEGAGQIVGHASLLRYYGNTREPGATGNPTTKAPLTGIVGQWIRVLIEDAGGSINIGGVNYSALWHGIVDAEAMTDDGLGGVQQWTCAGLVADLARRAITDGWVEVTKADGTKLVGHYMRSPPLNEARGATGASSTAYSIGGATAIKIPALGGPDLTAKEVLLNALITHADWYNPATGSWVIGVTWNLSAGTLLDYPMPALEPQAQSVADILNLCVSPRRGLSYRVTVSGTTATINVRSIAATAVGSLPAATDTATPTLTSIWHQGVQVIEDQSATYDRVEVVGGKCWTGLSMAYDPANATAQAQALIQGWTAGEETTWSSGTGPANDKVWRTFTVNPKWDGRTYNSSTVGMPNALSLTPSTSDYDGGRVFYPLTTAGIPTNLVDATATLPCGEGFTTDLTGGRQSALAFWKPKGSSTWRDLQSHPICARTVSVDGPPIAVSVGAAFHESGDQANNQQLQNKNNLETSGVLVVTLGIIEANPLRVSWTRASGSWPRLTPRTLCVSVPSAEYWQVINGTVTGVSSGSLTTTTGLVLRNDLAKLDSALDFCVAYFSEPARALSWTERGVIDRAYGSGATAPAALVTTATLSSGTKTINAVVTRRTWRLASDGYGTSYATDRVVPDMDAIR
jgi:hypothetical protein